MYWMNVPMEWNHLEIHTMLTVTRKQHLVSNRRVLRMYSMICRYFKVGDWQVIEFENAIQQEGSKTESESSTKTDMLLWKQTYSTMKAFYISYGLKAV